MVCDIAGNHQIAGIISIKAHLSGFAAFTFVTLPAARNAMLY